LQELAHSYRQAPARLVSQPSSPINALLAAKRRRTGCRTRRIIGRYGVVLLYPDEERWARDTMLMSMPTASLCTVPFDLLARARSRWHGSVRLWWQCDRLRFCMVLCYYSLHTTPFLGPCSWPYLPHLVPRLPHLRRRKPSPWKRLRSRQRRPCWGCPLAGVGGASTPWRRVAALSQHQFGRAPPALPYRVPAQPRFAAAACLLAPIRGWHGHGAGATAGLGGSNGICSPLVESRPRTLPGCRQVLLMGAGVWRWLRRVQGEIPVQPHDSRQ